MRVTFIGISVLTPRVSFCCSDTMTAVFTYPNSFKISLQQSKIPTTKEPQVCEIARMKTSILIIKSSEVSLQTAQVEPCFEIP